MTTYFAQRDAAYPGSIGSDWSLGVGGYLHGPNALNPWTPADWAWFKGNRKLPIWVGGLNGSEDAAACLAELHALAVPAGAYVVADMETRVDETYVTNFGAGLQGAGYKVWVYGSTSTIFFNPQLNGYWVADPTGTEHMFAHPAVRATQWVDNVPPGFDVSALEEWVVPHVWL